MADKEKLLAAAQKSLQKGQIPKAIKDYQKVVEIDPRDMRNRQRLAELCSRARMTAEALEQYGAVARHYADNGFYLKAIAVFKQMQRLDPDQPAVYHRLAELNVKQGLVGNALTEYRSLLAWCEKNRKTQDAVEVLQKMRELDPENLGIRVRIAEGYLQNGLRDRGREEFREILTSPGERIDSAAALGLGERVLRLFPEDRELKSVLAEVLTGLGEAGKGIELLRDLLRDDPENPGTLRQLARSYRRQGDFENERLTCQHLLKSSPDDLGLREDFLRSCLDGGEHERALAAFGEWRDALAAAGRTASLKELHARLQQAFPGDSRLGRIPPASVPSSETPSSPVGDEEVLEAAPAGEIPGLAAAAEDGELEELSLDFLSAGEPEPAPAAPAPEATGAGALLETELDLEFDLDLELGDPGQEAAPQDSAPTGSGEPVADAAGGGEEEFVELELIEPLGGEEPDARLAAEDLLDLAEVLDEELPAAPVDVRNELEEAEFYLQQGLLDDAARVCRALLEADPACGEARRKLDEVEARRRPAPPARKEAERFHSGPALAAEVVSSVAEGLTGLAEAERSRLDGVFSEFKKGVESQVDLEDSETHYNLGIAYKEMGLLDDAVAEFEKAQRNPERAVDCLTLRGICLAEKGAFAEAEEAFKSGLARPELKDGERISLRYELGLLYEAWGRPLEALDSFQGVADADLFYRSVGEKIQSLRKGLGLDPAGGRDESGARGDKDRVSYL